MTSTPTSPPERATGITSLELGFRLGRLEAGQEALKASQEALKASQEAGFERLERNMKTLEMDMKTDMKTLEKDIRLLLRFFWGAAAVIGLLVVLVPVGITVWTGEAPPTGARAPATEVAE